MQHLSRDVPGVAAAGRTDRLFILRPQEIRRAKGVASLAKILHIN